jgi:chaperone BCS1
MEDIDAAFSQTMNREEVDETPSADKQHEKRRNQPPPSSTSRITLSGLLNALDGVGAQEGRILFATTNKYNALDPALCRPGRMDIHIEFKLASKHQAQELYRCFYLPEYEDEGTAKPADEKAATTLSEKNSPVSGHSHRSHTLKLSRAEVDVLAARFADAIPEREFSMASLQGYLMTFKIRPEQAITDAPAWIEKERAERAKQGNASYTLVLSSSGSTEGDVEEEDVEEDVEEK